MILTTDKILVSVGMLGQLCFSARFIIQWIYSEKKKKSVIPVSFWYFSLVGGIIVLIYAIFKKDPVFIMGQAPGVFIYSRNIYLIHKRKKRIKERNFKMEEKRLEESKLSGIPIQESYYLSKKAH